MKSTNDNFNSAISGALEKEFAWLENFKNPDEDHAFSPEFEEKMNKIFSMPEYTYVSVGKRRIRKSVFIILISLLVLIAAQCTAVTIHQLITWNEKQNDSQGTLDITFDIENSIPANADFQYITPKTPKGYTITNKEQDTMSYTIEYANAENEIIYYSQNAHVENMSISIDNENSKLTEIKINGFKGYSYQKDGVSELLWTDGVYFYILQGTCPMEVLEEMSRNIVQPD